MKKSDPAKSKKQVVWTHPVTPAITKPLLEINERTRKKLQEKPPKGR